MDEEKISYEGFIYGHQFARKISIAYFFLTRKAIIVMILNVAAYWYFYNGSDIPLWQRLIPFVITAYLLKMYISTKLKTVAKLKMIPKNGWKDEKADSVLLLSKKSWAVSKYINKEESKK